VQNSADLSLDQPLGQFAKVQVQDGLEGARHVRGCGKELGQARIRFQLPPELFSTHLTLKVVVLWQTGRQGAPGLS
jgi:hypothetical protein